MISKDQMNALAKRRETADAAGGKEKIEKRHSKGLLTARERLLEFFDDGTFLEFGKHVQHSCHSFGLDKKSFPGDGVVCGTGYVEGRPVAAFSQDFTVSGGAVGRMHGQKICDLMEFAVSGGMPVVGINDSGGARIQEGVESLSAYGNIFFKNVLLSGVVPQIAIIAGPCAGGAAYSPALTDFLIMTRENANMFICGPSVIKAATGQEASLEQFASADAHASVSGNIHLIANDDKHAMDLAAHLLSYLPSTNLDDAPHDLHPDINMEPNPVLDDLVPESNRMPLDMHAVIGELIDEGTWFEIMPDWAGNIITGFARIEGVVVGIVGNQPKVKAGCIDIDASDKSARFIRVCNIYSIPLISLVDVPGFMPGLAQERGGIIRHGAKMLFAWASATVPKITLICRKAYGGAYLAMCSKDMGADLVYAWPSAEIAVMGAEGAVGVLYGKEIKVADDPKAVQAEKVKEYEEKFAAPWQAAESNMITDVIKPSESRPTIALGLRSLLNKNETRPPKKHGNIPL